MLITRPHTFAVLPKIREFAEEIVIPEELQLGQEFYSEHFEGALPIPTRPLGDGVFQSWLMKSWIPQGQLMDLHNPVSAAIGMLTPLIKLPLEMGPPLPDFINKKFGGHRGWNKNFFFNTPLDESTIYMGKVMSSRDRNLDSSIRLVNMWNKSVHNQHLPWYRASIEHMVGRPFSADLFKLRNRRFWDLDRDMDRVKNILDSENWKVAAWGERGLDVSYLLRRRAELMGEFKRLEAEQIALHYRRTLEGEERNELGRFDIFKDPRIPEEAGVEEQ
jgi:hypothetical protein